LVVRLLEISDNERRRTITYEKKKKRAPTYTLHATYTLVGTTDRHLGLIYPHRTQHQHPYLIDALIPTTYICPHTHLYIKAPPSGSPAHGLLPFLLLMTHPLSILITFLFLYYDDGHVGMV
jgi:hypothetical protein